MALKYKFKKKIDNLNIYLKIILFSNYWLVKTYDWVISNFRNKYIKNLINYFKTSSSIVK